MSVKTNIAVKYFEIGRSELNWNFSTINKVDPHNYTLITFFSKVNKKVI